LIAHPTRALVPGTFDPITSGHLDVIERTAQLFDEVIVGVAESRNKRNVGTLFDLGERVTLIEEATAHLPHVKVKPFSNLIVDFARENDADVCVKGLRALTDFEAEFQMAALNFRLDPEFETVFIMSQPEHMYLSSSIVKEIASMGGSVKGLVPPCVEQALIDKYAAR